MTPLRHSEIRKYLAGYFVHDLPDFVGHLKIPDFGNGVLVKNSYFERSKQKLNLDWRPFEIGGSH